ncbi:MAG TPA: hypothetical protein VIQ55_06610 [Burkholderiales bacterium]|jgi:hypothetical protein
MQHPLRRTTDQQPLRRITDRVVQTGAAAAEQAGKRLTEVGKRGNEAARSAYGYAMNHPRTTAAVVLGTGVAAALLWLFQRNSGYTATRRKVLKRVRSTSAAAK